MDRFRAYLGSMVHPDGDDLAIPPLGLINPMAGEPVSRLLAEYQKLGAEDQAREWLAELATEPLGFPGEISAGLVVCDDLRGGWTNRWAFEHHWRFQMDPRGKRFWITGILWSSEPPSLEAVRVSLLGAAWRAVYQWTHGLPRTLGQKLLQETFVLGRVGPWQSPPEAEEAEYTRQVIEPYLEEKDMPRAVQCLFGDPAGATLGFAPMGLSLCAGLDLARWDARKGRHPLV